jgi:hypothetical protein
VKESHVSDGYNTIRNKDVCQADALIKCSVTNTYNCVWDRNIGEEWAISECGGTDASNAAGDCISSSYTARKSENGNLALVEQYSIKTALSGISWIYGYHY